MPSFRDTKGRQWSVRITPWDMVRVKEFTGVELGTILRDGMSPLVDLLENEREFCVVLFALCKPACDEQQVSDEDFLTAVFGDPIEDAARAFQEALVDTFPTRQTIGLVAALQIQKLDPEKSRKKLDELLTALTPLDSRSRWQRVLAFLRGLTPATS